MSPADRGRPSAFANVALSIYLVVATLALIWPGYPMLGNRIEPFILGLPFSLTWCVGWTLLTFLVLLAYHLGHGED